MALERKSKWGHNTHTHTRLWPSRSPCDSPGVVSLSRTRKVPRRFPWRRTSRSASLRLMSRTNQLWGQGGKRSVGGQWPVAGGTCQTVRLWSWHRPPSIRHADKPCMPSAFGRTSAQHENSYFLQLNKQMNANLHCYMYMYNEAWEKSVIGIDFQQKEMDSHLIWG